MPRIRTIKPEFWDSPGTARATLRARLFYIAMWNWADDHGRGTANAKQLVGFAFPNDDDVTAADFPRLAAEVADVFSVVFYEVDGRPFYAIPSWDKHQKNERKAHSRHPAPPEGVSAGQRPSWVASAEERGSSAATSGSSGPGTGEQGNRGTGENSLCPTAGADRTTDADRFEEFWTAYGHKVKRVDAEKAWKKAIQKTDPETIIAAVGPYVQSIRAGKEARGDRAPDQAHASTWLNGERWNDERPSNVHHLRPEPDEQGRIALPPLPPRTPWGNR